MSRARSKGNGGGTFDKVPDNVLTTADGDPLVTTNGIYLTGEGLLVPTSIHEYMPFRLDEAFGITVDTEADDPDVPTNWADVHSFTTDDLVAGTYLVNFIFLWDEDSVSTSAYFRPSVNGVASPGFLRLEPSDRSNIYIETFALIREHVGGPLLATLQGLVETAANPATVSLSQIQVKRVD